MIIGLTGQSGAGKSTVSEILVQKGFYVIDCDKIAREVTKNGSSVVLKLAERFGSDILFDDNSLNRKKLAEKAFSSKENTKALNEITHPAIIGKISESIKENKDEVIVLDAPTLFESGANMLCDKILCILADENVRIDRIIKRDNITREQAIARVSAQKNDEFFINNCDAVIYNNTETEKLKVQLNSFLNNIGVI